jgi:hypothetical protein
MKSSRKSSTSLGMGGLVALVALAVALCAQAALAAASVAGPGERALNPNTIRHPVAVAPRKAGPVASGGRTIPVTTTVDGGPGSLRQAIAEAQDGDTIALPAGTYVLTQGELTIERALRIAGAGAARTTIDGHGDTRAFSIRVPFASDTAVTISGLTITHAKASTLTEFGTLDGSAIASLNADLTLRDDAIVRNSNKLPAEELVFGGVVLANGGRFTMVGTTVSENVVSVPSGDAFGGFILGGAMSIEGVESAVLENSKIIGNRSESLGGGFGIVVGGGLRIVSFGAALITGSAISGNVARAGAGEVVGGGMHVVGEPTRLVADQMVSNLASAGSGIAEGGGLSFAGIGGIAGSAFEANRVLGAEGVGGNLRAQAGFFLDERELTVSHTSVLHGLGPAGSENCAVTQEARIASLGFNRESTDQCGFHAEGDQVNVG